MKKKALLVSSIFLLAALNSFAAIPKYVFLFIGDGMALPQVSSAEIYEGALKGGSSPDAPRVLSFTKFSEQGIMTTHDASSFIPDSASSGTAMSTGNKTLDGVISMDSTKRKSYKSIAKLAKANKMKVGIISSVSIDHATPAVFYANVPSRGMMYEISLQLADSGFDYFAGGSVADPDGKKSKMESKPGNTFEYAKTKGYKIADTTSEFRSLKKGDNKVWVITENPADASSMSYEIDRAQNDPSLADFTKKGIELLDNKNGFFMMVEGGKIDWACHANDAMSAIKDVFSFDAAVKEAVEFAKKHPKDTLIVVTGDHETGGMAIGFSGTKYSSFYQKLKYQKMSFIKFNDVLKEFLVKNPSAEFEDVMPLITDNFGLTINDNGNGLMLSNYEVNLLKTAFQESKKDSKSRVNDDQSYLNYGGYDPLTVQVTHILNNKAGIGWTTYSHTGVPVPVYAYGVDSNKFNGYYDNTDLFKKLVSIMNLKN